MNFNQVLAEVLRLTGRPDKAALAMNEINAAINYCCVDSNFARDFTEDIFAIDNTLYAQNLALTEFERWRKFLYLKPQGRRPLTRLDPDKVFGECNREMTDVYYISGDNVIFKTCTLNSNLLVGWYRYPPVLTTEDDNNTFWLLEVSPYMIIQFAAAKVFADIGNLEESNRLNADANLKFISAKKDYKYGQSYGA